MAGEWVGLVGTVIGVLIGGGVTYFVTHAQIKHEEKLDRRHRQLSKIETTHELFSKVSEQSYLISVMVIGKLAYGATFDFAKMSDKLPLNELQMNADIYIPEVSSKVKNINEKWLEYGKVLAEIILKPSFTDTERGDYLVKSTQMSISINSVCQEAKQIVVEKAKKYL